MPDDTITMYIAYQCQRTSFAGTAVQQGQLRSIALQVDRTLNMEEHTWRADSTAPFADWLYTSGWSLAGSCTWSNLNLYVEKTCRPPLWHCVMEM